VPPNSLKKTAPKEYETDVNRPKEYETEGNAPKDLI